MRILDKEDNNKRTKLFLQLVSFVFIILITRLYYIQIIKGAEYLEKAERNSLRVNIITPIRGKIYDKNGEILATNTTAYQLIYKNSFNTTKLENDVLKALKTSLNKEREFSKLKESSRKKIEKLYEDIVYMQKITNMDYDDIVDKFYKEIPEGSEKILIIDEEINQEIALTSIELNERANIDIVEYNKRYYPKNNIASHIIGNVKLISEKEYNELKNDGYRRNDIIGKNGIEKSYDKIMKGIVGKEYVEVNAKGHVLNKIYEENSILGKDVYLSIDYNLQKYMTERFVDEIGTFIAIDIKTGKILTYVSYPEIDSNVLSSKISQENWEKLLNSKKNPLLNRGIAGLFPPASTIKVVTGAAFLEQGLSPHQQYYSTGVFEYGRVKFRDSKRSGHGYTNFYKAVAESVNTYFYNYILKVDRNKYFNTLKDFGIGELTGIDIPGEKPGVLPTPKWKKERFKKSKYNNWLPGDLINMSIGQGYMLSTPMQILMVYQAIANDGVMMYPTFVECFVDHNNKKEYKIEQINRKLNVKESTIKDIQKALKLATEVGTARRLKSLPVKVSAKTGTAQNSGENHSWMAGYFPSDNPQIAFVSLIENGGYGSVSAGNKVYDFIEKYYEVKGEKE